MSMEGHGEPIIETGALKSFNPNEDCRNPPNSAVGPEPTPPAETPPEVSNAGPDPCPPTPPSMMSVRNSCNT